MDWLPILGTETVRDTVKAAISAVRELYQTVVQPPLRVTIEMLTDTLEGRKWFNRIRIGKRVDEILRREKIAKRILPPSFIMPYVDATGDVEDETLDELWARLLASAVANDLAQHPAFIVTAKQLTPDEAEILSRFGDRDEYPCVTTGNHAVVALCHPVLSVARRVSAGVLLMYLENLKRLGLLDIGGGHAAQEEYGKLTQGNEDLLESFSKVSDLSPRSHSSIFLTQFGRRFVQAAVRGENAATN